MARGGVGESCRLVVADDGQDDGKRRCACARDSAGERGAIKSAPYLLTSSI